ncbi:hypothetical protein BV898_19157 [Hypsibius exemplaris]|uniref:Uncharacterized protein n=1 Tax=Hypsibius exemplaris TaxID=2072580 RepID=A0A9X6NIR8_HYPEX|nr:hypothetical protein BV898_19157 [Hypsibius exemplaris]
MRSRLLVYFIFNWILLWHEHGQVSFLKKFRGYPQPEWIRRIELFCPQLLSEFRNHGALVYHSLEKFLEHREDGGVVTEVLVKWIGNALPS